MTHPPFSVLANLPFPAVEGYCIRTFGEYRPDPGAAPWRPERERRSLAEILPLIPTAERPDILLIASPEYLPIPADVDSFPGLKVLLITDWNVCLRFLPDLCPLFDFCFTDWPGYRLLRRGGLANVHHQPLFGHDPARFRPLGLPRDLDLSFCGNLNARLHGERNRLLSRVARWGTGRSIHLRPAFDDAYVEVLNRSRLVFNYSIRGEANMRLFETMACGAVPLVEDSNQEVSILFQEGVHYFRYSPDRLEERLNALLADPARLEAASRAAQEAVSKHTKAAQIRALLDFTGQEPRRSLEAAAIALPAGRAALPPFSPSLSPDQLRNGLKAVAKIRILGSGYTLDEAFQELRVRAGEFPGLQSEGFPALLLSGIATDRDLDRGLLRTVLDGLLDSDALPPALRFFCRAQAAEMRGEWSLVLEATARCLESLAEPIGLPEGREPYRYLYHPIDIGQGFNTDLNRAFREDLQRGSWRGLAELLGAHCAYLQARAFMETGRTGEGLALAERLPKGRFDSLDVHAVLVEAYRMVGDTGKLRVVLGEWFSERPLDTAVWQKRVTSLQEIGDRRGLADFLGEILLLAERFLSGEQVERVKGLMAREMNG